MALLQQPFFENGLSVGNAARYLLETFDGDVELDLKLPPTARVSFMYKLWRSTEGEQKHSFEGFELKQFVLLQQLNGKLLCKVRLRCKNALTTWVPSLECCLASCFTVLSCL